MENLIKTSTENLMIAQDLKSAGFGVQVIDGYNAVRVHLGKGRGPSTQSVRWAMERAGYEDCQYTLNRAVESVYVRAIGPE